MALLPSSLWFADARLRVHCWLVLSVLRRLVYMPQRTACSRAEHSCADAPAARADYDATYQAAFFALPALSFCSYNGSVQLHDTPDTWSLPPPAHGWVVLLDASIPPLLSWRMVYTSHARNSHCLPTCVQVALTFTPHHAHLPTPTAHVFSGAWGTCHSGCATPC